MQMGLLYKTDLHLAVKYKPFTNQSTLITIVLNSFASHVARVSEDETKREEDQAGGSQVRHQPGLYIVLVI
jgi:hypothetical protein